VTKQYRLQSVGKFGAIFDEIDNRIKSSKTFLYIFTHSFCKLHRFVCVNIIFHCSEMV